jgi:hypothetical protein
MMMSKKLRIAALLAAALSVGAVNAQGTLSRSDVQSDLTAWKLSGMDKFHQGEASPNTFSPEYQAAYQRYLRLVQGDQYQAPAAGKTRAEVKADLELWKRSGMARFSGITTAAFTSAYEAAYQNYLRLKLGDDYQAPVALTREEVQADLAKWKQAGLDKFWQGEQTPDMNSPAYRSAMERYQQM